jgi:hypothetical protein
LAQWAADGIGSLDDIKAALAMTPENFKLFNNTLKDSFALSAKTAEEEFAPLKEKVQTALDDTTAVITDFEKSQKLIDATTSVSTTIVDNLAKGLTDGFTAKQEELNTAASTMIANVGESLKSAVTAVGEDKINVFQSIGTMIAQGIADGIKEGTGIVSGAMTALIQAALTAAQKASQIASPSKLFRKQIGANIGLGIGAGIEDTMPDIVAEMRGYTKMLADAANQTMSVNMRSTASMEQQNQQHMISQLSGLMSRQNAQAAAGQPKVTVVLEPTADMRGFFDYIRVGVQRSEYLNGGKRT